MAGPGGTTVTAGGGTPAASGITGPGAGAHVAAVPVALAGNTLTLTPPASALTGSGITYPVYIDPSLNTNASWWTQVDSGFPTTSYWNESGDLQAGYDDWPGNNGMGKARSFVRLPMPNINTDAVVSSADLYMDDVWSADGCTATAAQLYSTTGISSATTWNNQPTWQTDLQQQSLAFVTGSSGCGSYKDDVTWSSNALTNLIQHNITVGQAGQTFGIRAASETDDLQWKQYHNPGGGYIHLSVTYNDPPNQPSNPATEPVGGCHTSSTNPPVIGLDDLTLSATVSDNDGDNNLTTQFILHNSDNTTAWDSANHNANVVKGNGDTAPETALTRTVMQGLHSGEWTYYWQAKTTDGVVSQASSLSGKCWFTYNPLAPSSDITISVPATGTLGQTITGSFSPASSCSPTTTPCPASYVYELGARTPQTVTADSSGTAGSVPITIPQTGPIQLTVYAVASGGNYSAPVAGPVITGTPPATAYKDGYFTGGTYPDLLFTRPGTKPSLWLATGSGNGTLSPPVDIGSLGTTINAGSDGPGDWNGAIVLHGAFTSPADKVQDVMAYYPATGSGEIVAGDGTAGTLQPVSGNVSTVKTANMQNPNTGANAVQLVAAGNVSGLSTGTDDLLGISGNSTSPNNYELDLYTNGYCASCASTGGYLWNLALTITAPDGTSDWNNYTLATAANPASTVLFALNASTGALWECATPYQSLVQPVQQGGTGACNWARLTVPWGASPPQLASADINHAGQTELWTLASGTATAYTLGGTTLSSEATGTDVSGPLNDWPVTDGSDLAQGSAAPNATDTITGNTAALSATGATWNGDDYFNTNISLDGTAGYLTPPAGTIPSSATSPKIEVWFRTTTPGGVLVSLQSGTISSGSTTSWDPVMYIGTDGHLYAEWWKGSASPAISASPVDDGLWHHAWLTGTGTSQSLYVDNQPGVGLGGTINLSGQGQNLYFGTGYIGGNWPAEPNNQKTAKPWYFNGDLADIYYSYPGGP
jgi:hypothetical protein